MSERLAQEAQEAKEAQTQIDERVAEHLGHASLRLVIDAVAGRGSDGPTAVNNYLGNTEGTTTKRGQVIKGPSAGSEKVEFNTEWQPDIGEHGVTRKDKDSLFVDVVSEDGDTQTTTKYNDSEVFTNTAVSTRRAHKDGPIYTLKGNRLHGQQETSVDSLDVNRRGGTVKKLTGARAQRAAEILTGPTDQAVQRAAEVLQAKEQLKKVA